MIVFILVGTAEAADVAQSANLLAAGGVGVASSDDNTSITLNPAGIGIRKRYDFSAQLGYGPHGGLSWGATIMDARTSDYLAAGFAYTGDRINPPLNEDQLPGFAKPHEDLENIHHDHDFAGAVAVPFLHRHVSVGVGMNVGLWDYERLGKGTSVDGHVGLAVRPIDGFELGVVGRDLLPSDVVQDRPPEVLGGARAVGKDLGWLEVNGGWRQGDRSPILAAGAEVGSGKGRFRGGWRMEDGVNGVSAGIGWTDTGGSIEYGIFVPLGPSLGANTVVQEISVRFSAPDSITPPD